jgi:hypothetical protein
MSLEANPDSTQTQSKPLKSSDKVNELANQVIAITSSLKEQLPLIEFSSKTTDLKNLYESIIMYAEKMKVCI